MHKVPYLFVANWKMAKTFNESKLFWQTWAQELVSLATHEVRIIIAPTYLAITQAVHSAGRTIAIAAQDCSAHPSGAFTGQVDAVSLAQAGCSYVIIGHLERRIAGDTNESVRAKLAQALSAGLTPIICVGDSVVAGEYVDAKNDVVQQLEPLHQVPGAWSRALIAYEPHWSIGTGVVPSVDHLNQMVAAIEESARAHGSSRPVLLYGGSVDEHSCRQIASSGLFDGFLIGGASLDFKKFQNIVSLSRLVNK